MTLLECAKVLISPIPDRPQGCSSATLSTAYATLSFSQSASLSPSSCSLTSPPPSCLSCLPSVYFISFFSCCVPLSKTSRCTRLRIMQTMSMMWCGHPCTPRSSPPWTAWVVWICGTWTTTLRWGNALGLVPQITPGQKMHQNNNKFLSVWASPHRPPLNQLSDSSSPTARTTIQRRSFPHTHSLQAEG